MPQSQIRAHFHRITGRRRKVDLLDSIKFTKIDVSDNAVGDMCVNQRQKMSTAF